jgi:hypothetical protein
MDYPHHRRHPRFNVSVPVEVHPEGSATPYRCATSDLSVDGCYIETMYPFPIGTSLDLKLQVGECTLLILGRVVTCYPQVGNGIEFARILPEDLNELRAFLESVAEQAAKTQ